jgi:hypothetical protein
MEYKDKRVEKLRQYLFTIVDEMMNDTNSQINVNMLSNDINNYSLDKIPTASTVEKWIMGIEIHKDTFAFRSRFPYSQDAVVNLTNIGFFENFEYIVNSNNKKGILPKIDGIESIECLNPGTLTSVTSNTAEFEIQIQIKYRINNKKED